MTGREAGVHRQWLGLTMAMVLLGQGCAGDDNRPAEPKLPSLHESARTAEAGFDYRSAAANYRTLHAEKPEDADIALGLARTLRYTGETREASAVLAEAMTRFGATVPLLLESGKLNVAMDRHADALKILERARDLDPGNWRILAAIGVTLDYLESYPEAQEAYRSALVLSPENPSVLNNLGLSLALSGAIVEGIATLDRAAHHPDATIQVRQNLALLKAFRGDTTAAERLAAKDLPPNMADRNGDYYRGLATMLKQRGAVTP